MFTKVLTISTLVAFAQAGVFELQPEHHATSYSSINKQITPKVAVAQYAQVAPVAHYTHVAPVAHVAAVAHQATSYSSINKQITPVAKVAVAQYAQVAPVAHYTHVAPVAHVAAVAHQATSYSSINKHIAPVAKVAVAPVAHYTHVAPVAHVAHVAHVAPIAHVAHIAPVAHVAHVAPVLKAVHQEVYADAHPHYAFEYGVKDSHTGDDKNQHEERDGDVVKGSYTLVQPDGITRTVHYTADDHNGFNAQVEYSGHAAHPQIVQKAVLAKAIIPTAVYHH